MYIIQCDGFYFFCTEYFTEVSLQRYKDIIEVTGGRLVPEWMDVDMENFKGTIKNLPTREMIDVPVDEMLIVELYSK